MKKPKLKICKNPKCKKKFMPYYSTDTCCSYSCKRAIEKKTPFISFDPAKPGKDKTATFKIERVKIPEEVTRDWFEALLPSKQKQVAKILFERVKLKVLQPILKQQKKDITGNYIVDLHHCWFKSQAPLWYYFQEENVLPVSREGHRAIHDRAFDKMTAQEAVLWAEADSRKDICKEDHFEYLKKELA